MATKGLSWGDSTVPARIGALASVLVGLVALAGWICGIQALTSVFPGSVEMQANTALGLTAAGLSLFLLTDRPGMRLRQAAQMLAAGVAILGLATLVEHLFALDLHIDEFLVKDVAGAFNVFRGRMSPYTAAAFVAMGTALLALPYRRLDAFTKVGAAVTFLVGIVSVVGYLWNAEELVTDAIVPPVAINTAVCLALMGAGIFTSPHQASDDSRAHRAEFTAIEVKFLAGFSIAFALLLAGGSYTYRNSVLFAESVQWVTHSERVRAGLADLAGSVAGAELAQRDYLLTADPLRLAEYAQLVDVARRHLADIAYLTADNPEQQANLAQLKPIVEARITQMQTTLTAFAAFGLQAARAVIAVGRNVNTVRQVRAVTLQMDAVEIRLLAARQSRSTGARRITLLSLLLTVGVAAAVFAALFRGIHREMRARQTAELALRASDQYNRSIVDSSPDCLAVLTLDARLSSMAPQGCRLMEVDDFAAIANSEWLDWWPTGDRQAARNAVELARSGSAGRFQGFCPTLKGRPKWWDVIVMPVRRSNGQPERLLAVARDISKHREIQNELVETNRFLDSLIENLPVMVIVKDAGSLRIVRHNREAERLLGLSHAELVGRAPQEFMSAAEASFGAASDLQALTSGALVDVPEETIETRGLGLRTLHTMKTPIAGRDGKPQFLLTIAVDITERKLTEQAVRELNLALQAKASQLEATNQELESFSYSVSHDLRAPLRAIDGFALMIEEDYRDGLDDEGRRYLSVIRENSKRMGALIDDLLSFSQLGRLPVASHEINVDALVREVIGDLMNGDEAAFPKLTVGTLPPVHGDRNLLRQVWMNLLSNAVKYSSKAANPVIEITGRANGTEVLYAVRDNGVGFDMAYVGKLFGVFQRLHRTDEFSGTGVGLAIVHRVVTRHGGRVWAEGNIGKGAVFSFALPKEHHDG